MASEILDEIAQNGSLVKIFWTDSTGEDRVKKGHVLKIGSDFVKFETHHNDYFVSRSAISSIQVVEGQDRKGSQRR